MPLTIRSYSSHHGGATCAVLSSAMIEQFFSVASMVAMAFLLIFWYQVLELSNSY